MERLDISKKPIYVPEYIATCPSCHEGLIVDLTEAYVDDDGKLRIGDFSVSCCAEPDFEDKKLRAKWEMQHSIEDRMPYIYWLPVDQAVRQWLEFVEAVDTAAEMRKLKRWNEWASGS